jgi:Ca2+/Na+ antiporter
MVDYSENDSLQYYEPVVSEFKVRNPSRFLFAFVIGLFLAIIFIGSLFYFDFEIYEAFGLFALMIVVYAIILFFLLETKKVREIKQFAVKTVERPVTREVIVEKPVVKEVVIEKEVPKEVIKEVKVEKPVYIQAPAPARKKVQIKKYEYVASSEEKTYHKRTCRFAKLIKRKYKESNDSEEYFKKKGYEPCKVCIKPKKKSK